MDFQYPGQTSDEIADLNLLFIEEPEAHTHPQMQYIFIKNIKDVLSKDVLDEKKQKVISLQTIITTHSSHIVSGSEFNDIKYFVKKNDGEGFYVESKNLKDLEIKYKKEKDNPLPSEKSHEGNSENLGTNHFKFLKQYLTLNRSEIFFADKVILIEGDTERILIPAMMKKIDNKSSENDISPLLSQNISIIEVGAYSQIFDLFIKFIGIKTLVITDIDFDKLVKSKEENDKEGNKRIKCSAEEANDITDASIKHFYDYELKQIEQSKDNIIEFLKEKQFVPLVSDISDGEEIWRLENPKDEKEGNILLVWQTEEKNSADDLYYARSFEDSFIHINKQFLYDNYKNFQSLKPQKIEKYIKGSGSDFKNLESYKIADKMIESKTSFALDILIYSDENYSNWQIPEYIKEGLIWLRKD